LSDAGIEHQFSNHDFLNALNFDLLLKTNTLKAGNSYDFDFDHQFIACEKYD
jgi:hypothetical protein